MVECGEYLAKLVMNIRGSYDLISFDQMVRFAAFAIKQFSVFETPYKPVIRQGKKADDQEMVCFVRYLYGYGFYSDPKRREGKF